MKVEIAYRALYALCTHGESPEWIRKAAESINRDVIPVDDDSEETQDES